MQTIRDIVRQRQLAIRRELDRRGLHLKVVAFDSGISYDTLCSYFPGGERQPAELPASAIYCLRKAIPLDLMNLLEPEGFAVVQVPAGLDFDAIAEAAADFIQTKNKFHHPASELGREIGPREEAELGCKVLQLRGRVA